MNAAARLEAAAARLRTLAAPFLGLAAVGYAAPERFGLLALTGWLPLTLHLYLDPPPDPEATPLDRALPWTAPVAVALGQGFTGSPGWQDWAIEGALCGMGARAVALGALLVGRLTREGGVEDWQMAGPGAALIVGAAVPTAWAFADAWRALHPAAEDVAWLGATFLLATVTELRRLASGPSADDDSVGWVLAGILLWLGVGFAAAALR